MRKTPFLLAAVAAVAIAAVYLVYRSVRPAGSPAPPAGGTAALRTAPPFALPDVSGNRVESAVFRGKPTVINFFATWCPPCREEIPGFVAVYEKYKDRGFELIGISLDTDTRGNLPPFMMQYRIGYRILLGDMPTARAYGGVSSIPTTFFIGKDGTIRNVHVGYMDREAFEREVEKLL